MNSAVVISVVVESSRCSSKTLQKGSCPYAPLDEALRYVLKRFFFLFITTIMHPWFFCIITIDVCLSHKSLVIILNKVAVPLTLN